MNTVSYSVLQWIIEIVCFCPQALLEMPIYVLDRDIYALVNGSTMVVLRSEQGQPRLPRLAQMSRPECHIALSKPVVDSVSTIWV